MLIFLHILSNNILPVFLTILAGYIVGKNFDLNVSTLSKLTFYILAPSFVFYNLYETELSYEMIKILGFALVYMLANDILGRIISKIRKHDIGMQNAFKNAIMFNNSGNIGVSLITLVFGCAPYIIGGTTPYLNHALTIQIIIMVFMNVSMNTIGLYNAGRAKMSFKNTMRKIMTLPVIYVLPIVLFLNYMNVDITGIPLWPAIVIAKSGLVPIALITLGVQLSKTKINVKDVDIHLAVFTRLIIGPLLAILGLHLFGFTGVAAQTLLISYSVPTAVTIALVAAEYDNNQSFTSQEVMMSTILSAVTLTLFIYLAAILFPI